MPGQVTAIPLIVDGKLALVVYGDNLPEQKSITGIDTLEIFMNQQAWHWKRPSLKNASPTWKEQK